MSFVPQAEYEQIRRSWRNGTPVPWKSQTNEQHLKACYANVQEAAKREANLRRYDQEWPIGDQRRNGDATTPSLRQRIQVAVRDQAHWREYVAFYRALCVKEFDAKPVAKAEQDRRLPREADEEGDDALPF